MSAYVIWLDTEHAKIFKIQPQKTEHKILHRHEVRHHTSSDPAKAHKDSEKLYHDISTQLTDAKEVLVIGPGVAKAHFVEHLKKHHHSTLASKVVGVETADHPTDNQILEQARKFFKNYDLFN